MVLSDYGIGRGHFSSGFDILRHAAMLQTRAQANRSFRTRLFLFGRALAVGFHNLRQLACDTSQ